MTPSELAKVHLAAFGAEKAWPETDFNTFLDDPRVLLVHEGQSFVLGRVVADEAEILTLATSPDQQRRGLAKTTLMRFLEEVRLSGVVSVFLEVSEDNHPARALYSSFDFKQVGERKNYYRNAGEPFVTALILKRELP